MLKIEQPQAFLSLEQGHVGQFSLVQVEPLWVRVSLRRFSVDDKDTWDLGKLCKDDFVFVFHSANDAVLQKVAIPLIVFVLGEFFRVDE